MKTWNLVSVGVYRLEGHPEITLERSKVDSSIWWDVFVNGNVCDMSFDTKSQAIVFLEPIPVEDIINNRLRKHEQTNQPTP